MTAASPIGRARQVRLAALYATLSLVVGVGSVLLATLLMRECGHETWPMRVLLICAVSVILFGTASMYRAKTRRRVSLTFAMLLVPPLVAALLGRFCSAW